MIFLCVFEVSNAHVPTIEIDAGPRILPWAASVRLTTPVLRCTPRDHIRMWSRFGALYCASSELLEIT